jgi:alpha-glucosidase
MELRRNGNKLSLIYKNREIFRHAPARPFACALDLRKGFRVNRGMLDIKDKVIKRYPLRDCRILAQGERESVLAFSGNGVRLQALIKEEHGLLRFYFESAEEKAWEFRLPSETDEAIFGGGEQFCQINLKGEQVHNVVSEHIALGPILQKTVFRFLPYRVKKHSEMHTYSPMTRFVSSKRYAVRFETDSLGVQDFTAPDALVFRYRRLPQGMAYAAEDCFAAIAKRFTQISPNNQYLPDWCLDGLIIGVQGGIDYTVKKTEGLLNAGVKVAGVWCQDWSGRKITVAGKQVYWNWEVDNAHYPALAGRISKLKEKGVRFLAYINPYVIEGGTMYAELKALGYLIKNKKNGVYHIKTTTFRVGMMDLTNPGMASYLKETIIKKNMLSLGISGYMADFGEYLPLDCVLCNGDPSAMHNRWPTLWARLNREALQEGGAEDEVMFFTRSGYNGCEQYTPIMWTGDQHTDYSADYGLRCVLPASFNLGFSGLTLIHSDVGGYISFCNLTRDNELFIRWMELNAFSPLLRSHETVRPDINAQPDSPGVARYAAILTDLHIGLKPYFKTCLENARKGIPVIAPDFYYSSDYSRHKDAYGFFCGEDIYVSPVMEQGTACKQVYLPDGEWVHFFTQEQYTPGAHTIDAPLGNPPAFYRKDSPFAPLFRTLGPRHTNV